MNAATMLAQSKNVMQTEIDAACEQVYRQKDLSLTVDKACLQKLIDESPPHLNMHYNLISAEGSGAWHIPWRCRLGGRPVSPRQSREAAGVAA